MALHLSGISTRAKLVMIGLCDCSNDDSFTCYPSRKLLAQIGDCSVDTVDRAIKELIDADLIDVQHQFRDDGDRIPSANLYRVFPHFDPSRKTAATPQKVAAEVRPGPPQDCGQGSRTLAGRVAARDAATNEPSYEPVNHIVPSARAPVSKDDIAALINRAGDACNPTCASLHHGADLNRLLRGGCDWDEDILPAVDRLAASFRGRGKRFGTWDLLVEHAVENRDRRLAGLPASKPTTGGGRAGYADTITRIAKEMGIE